ncbi:MAG: glycogen debranching protein GlgX, partial [Hyphomonadaceae bacterium]|nr:glycogen debranching protein GlgX [Hyphomonadaceae bacterium]
ELVLFNATGSQEIARCDLPARDGDIWHGLAPQLKVGFAYGYRVHGPFEPDQGHLFNPHKLLLDPYAKGLVGQHIWDNSHYPYVVERQNPDGPLDTRDNAPFSTKGLIVDPARLTSLARGPIVPWRDTLIYEMHAKGFTMRHPQVAEPDRGKFAGLSRGPALDYLRALGVTTLELLPIHAFVHDRFLVEQGLRNYWGYNTLNYFSPHGEYGAHDPIGEMRDFVNSAHEYGFEIILDVVYNHTCESGRGGPSLSFRGIDNAAYYRLNPQDKTQYADISGCGATLNANNPHVRKLILDSLAHWTDAYGIDGFRFDIAPSLGIDDLGNFHKDAPFFQECAADARLKNIKLISEPWDAAGGYHVGDFPAHWADWNDQARNSYRQFWRGDRGKARSFAEALSGSASLFADQGKPAYASVNFVACHDGFPLYDLTRFAHKHNLANGEGNRDGGDHDFSCNYGIEGLNVPVEINTLRERQAANMLASALLSCGTPMLLSGDEFGRTQGGNNNAYAQDNVVSWLDWSVAASPAGRARLALTKRIIALRKQIFAENAHTDTNFNIGWWNVWGGPMSEADWNNPDTRCFGALFEHGGWFIIFNASEADARFVLPPLQQGVWQQHLNTAQPDRPAGDRVATSGQTIDVMARSLAVFKHDISRTIGKSGHGF